MKKEKQIKTHQRRTKGGKTVIVRAHKAKYDAAEELKKMSKKKGAGDELESRKSKVEDVSPDLGFTDAEYKEWYHWDQEGDPKNKTALKVEKALIAKMGKRAYNKYFNDLSDSYSARGHSKAFKSLVAEHTETPTPKAPKATKAKEVSDSPGTLSAEAKKASDFYHKHLKKKLGKDAENWGPEGDYFSPEHFVRASQNLDIPPMKLAKWLTTDSHEDSVSKKLKSIVGEKEYEDERFYGDMTYAIMNGEWKKSKKTSKETDDFLSGKQGAINPQPKEKTSWGHTSREKGKAVRPLDMKGQANYNGIIASGLKLPKKFTYDSDTRSDWYDSFRTKDGQAISSVLQQAKKAKWQSSGDGRSKMKKFTSPDGRVHLLINRDDKSASIFYR